MPGAREAEPATSRTPRLTPALVAVGCVTAVAVVAAGAAGGWWLAPRPWFDGLSLSGPSVSIPPMAPSGPAASLTPASALQRWVAGGILALLGLAVLAGLVYLARWLWQRRPRRAVVVEDEPAATPAGEIAAEPDLSTLLRGAESAERILLEVGGIPRDVVLRCWLALEGAAADSGMPRRPADSPTEFTGAVLRATAADRGSVDTLLRLYHRARFSRHRVSDDDVRSAHAAVVRLARTWRGFDTAMRHTARAPS